MANYVFKNLQLRTPADLKRVIEAVSACAAKPINRVSLSLHAHSLHKLIQLVEGTSLSLMSAFCWSKSESLLALPHALLHAAKRARLTWANRQVSFEEALDLPWYDWDGSHSGGVGIRFSETFQRPFLKATAQPSSETWHRFASALDVVGSEAASKPTTSSSWQADQREHYYVATIPASRASEAIRQLCREFEFSNATCSWEICGPGGDLPEVLITNKAVQHDYPAGCYHLNGGIGGYNFAVQPHFLTPVLNCSLDEALVVANRTISSPTDCLLSIRRKFVSWQLTDGSPGSSTEGNGFQLRFERGHAKFYVGIEQFSDSDPPVKRVAPRFREIAAQLGVELKPNNLML